MSTNDTNRVMGAYFEALGTGHFQQFLTDDATWTTLQTGEDIRGAIAVEDAIKGLHARMTDLRTQQLVVADGRPTSREPALTRMALTGFHTASPTTWRVTGSLRCALTVNSLRSCPRPHRPSERRPVTRLSHRGDPLRTSDYRDGRHSARLWIQGPPADAMRGPFPGLAPSRRAVRFHPGCARTGRARYGGRPRCVGTARWSSPSRACDSPPGWMAAPERALSTDVDVRDLDGVVAVAEAVPGGHVGLHVAGRVGGACAQVWRPASTAR